MAELVMGIDGWKGRWVAVVLDGGVFRSALVADDIVSLLERVPEARVVGVDIPIGFPNGEPRRADIEARVFVGPRRSSVFPTLPREVYEAETYEAASVVCHRLWGKGLSKQSYGLRKATLEVDAVVGADDRLREVHPEVTFAAIAGHPLEWSKTAWNGERLRVALLSGEGIELPDDLGEASKVAVDDVLDAAACAWSAHRVLHGRSHTLPAGPAAGEPVITY